MAKPIRHQPAYLKLSDASKRFKSPDDLLAALREGTLRARGRLTTNYTGDDGHGGQPTEPIYGEPEPVPVSAWRDMELDLDRETLLDDQHYAAYKSVEILEADLADVALDGPSLGGRPQEHDWELILKQALVWVTKNPMKSGTKLDGWINELALNLPYCAKNGVPQEDALKKKFKDVYDDITGEKPLPDGAPKRRR